MKAGLLVTGLGFAMGASNANAALSAHEFDGNAVNYCQAFTPGPANTIRNRAVGAENVGTVPINIACSWHSTFGDFGATNPTSLDVNFYNNTNAPMTVTCSMFNGYQTQGGTGQYLSTKSTATMAPHTQADILWDSTSNPNTGATDLGNNLININCTLPPGAVVNDTYLYWMQDNGV